MNAPGWEPLAVAGAVIVEIALLASFNRWYFRFGVPLFRWRVSAPVSQVDPELSEHLQIEYAQSPAVALRFRDVGLGRIGFREALIGGGFFKLHYPPMMHGLIRIEPDRDQVTVTGYANLYICALLVSFISGAWRSADWAIGAGGVGFIALCYTTQAVRFGGVASQAARSAQLSGSASRAKAP
jgi:hypothetical protein